MLTVSVFFVLAAVAFSMPSEYKYVEWFRVVPARTVANKTVIRSYAPYDKTWMEFKQKHGKVYSDDEEFGRQKIFMENVKFIEYHNQRYINGEKSYYLDINQFADLTFAQFRKLNGFQHNYKTAPEQCSHFLAASNINLPEKVDWREKGYVTPIKNQGQCGSCWSFSTTGSLEGQTFKKTGKLPSLSEQQLVDCSGAYGNEGCNGGLMDQAFEYVKKYGIETEAEYPYEAKQERRCHYNRSETAAGCTGCEDIPSESETDLQKAVATVGPISVAIDASHQSFQFYKNGVYNEPECSSTRLDHGVLTVGYGVMEGSKYWLVKNSWGTVWGDEGYVYMSRDKDNQCGIATQASYPLV